ncbi:MAG: Zn-ribbon domain-containing OB-fold protein [Acidimicrobiales bacterium]
MTRLEPQPGGIPVPRPTRWSRPFWDGCAVGELRYQHCGSCGHALFNPAPICRRCRSRDLVWRVSQGRGAVYSWTVSWQPPSPGFVIPYAPVIVDLDEGYQMLSNVINCDTTDVRVGLEVEVAFRSVGEGVDLPYFSPRRRASAG